MMGGGVWRVAAIMESVACCDGARETCATRTSPGVNDVGGGVASGWWRHCSHPAQMPPIRPPSHPSIPRPFFAKTLHRPQPPLLHAIAPPPPPHPTRAQLISVCQQTARDLLSLPAGRAALEALGPDSAPHRHLRVFMPFQRVRRGRGGGLGEGRGVCRGQGGGWLSTWAVGQGRPGGKLGRVRVRVEGGVELRAPRGLRDGLCARSRRSPKHRGARSRVSRCIRKRPAGCNLDQRLAA